MVWGAAGAIPGGYTPPPVVLGPVTALRIERNAVAAEAARELYQDILEAGLPGPRDRFHEELLGITLDAGASLPDKDSMTQMERATRFQQIVHQASGSRENGILRIEHLDNVVQKRTHSMIDEIVQGNGSSQEHGGTIHLYLSPPNSAALNNHTDTTDIVVLKLDGAKEWLLCQVPSFLPQKQSSIRKYDKFESCATYEENELNQLMCDRQTLYAGDVLYLPKRVVHSARATSDGLSAHLTFAPVENRCFPGEDVREIPKPETSRRALSMTRWLLGTCNADEGGTDCNESCDSGCTGSCDLCHSSCGCGPNVASGCCDSGCDGSCDSGPCYSSCDAGCTTNFPAPLFGCGGGGGNGGSIGGILAGVVVVVGLCGLAYWYNQKRKQNETPKPSPGLVVKVAPPLNQSSAAPAALTAPVLAPQCGQPPIILPVAPPRSETSPDTDTPPSPLISEQSSDDYDI